MQIIKRNHFVYDLILSVTDFSLSITENLDSAMNHTFSIQSTALCIIRFQNFICCDG